MKVKYAEYFCFLHKEFKLQSRYASNMKNLLKETPISELTLRKYEKPMQLQGRELIKKTCLSLGLLQPGDSRDVIVDVFFVFLTEKKPLASEEVRKSVRSLRESFRLQDTGTASSNIRRQIKRLRDFAFIQKKGNFYSIAESATLTELFQEKIEQMQMHTIIARIKEYLLILDETYLKKNS